MSVKMREKRFMTPQEKHIRKLMIENDVELSEIADHEGVSPQAISLRLKSLTPSTMKHIEKVISKLSRLNAPTKVAS